MGPTHACVHCASVGLSGSALECVTSKQSEDQSHASPLFPFGVSDLLSS